MLTESDIRENRVIEDMKIVDYSSQEIGNVIVELFPAIYPNWDEQEIERMPYDEN